MTVLEDSALQYAQHEGFDILPLQPRGKIPLTQHGLDDATTDLMTIETWWSRWPDANVGIRTGNVVVVDEDREGALADLCARTGHTLPATRVARTGSGRHYYFTQPDGIRVRNTAGKLAEGIDTRGDGGYVVAPPSVHPNGTAYIWENETPPARLPAWLAELLQPRENGRQHLGPVRVAGETTPYGQKALEEEAHAVANAPEGTRNDRLNIAAFSLGQLVAGGELDERDARAALHDAARACGLSEREAEATITSGINGSLGSPRTAPETHMPPPRLHAVPEPETTPAVIPIAPLRVVTLDHFVSVTEDTADPIIGERGDSLLPANGLLFMYGDGGAGKTTLSIDALAHLAAGEPWLDLHIPVPVRILLIENEGPRGPFRETLAAKIQKWGRSPFSPNVHVLEEPWSRFTLLEQPLREAIATEIMGLEIDVVIVGPLASLGAKGAGTPDDVNDFDDLVKDLRARTARPFALWIVHHENKAGDVSGAWERLPDTLVHVSAQGNGKTRVHWRKVRWSSRLHNTSLGLLWDDGGFKLEEARQRDLPNELTIKFAQSDERWLTAKQLATLAAANVDKVRETLQQMTIEGRLVFEIGPKGRAANARCYRLRTDSDPPSHPESPDLFQGLAGGTDSVTPPYKESPESSHTSSSKPGDSNPLSHHQPEPPELAATVDLNQQPGDLE